MTLPKKGQRATMTYTELLAMYDFSPTKPDLRDRVAHAIADGWQSLIACTGRPASVITWCGYDAESPLYIGNFAFRIDQHEATGLGESVIAHRLKLA